jgi:hypothetical protein
MIDIPSPPIVPTEDGSYQLIVLTRYETETSVSI